MTVGQSALELALGVTLLASGCERTQAEWSMSPTDASAAEKAFEAPLIEGTRVRMPIPAGAHSGTGGVLGYTWPEGASIVVLEMPAPYSESAKGLTQERLASQGMTLLSSEQIDADGRAAQLVHVTQEVQGTRYRKWLLSLGDELNTVIILASYPEALADRFADRLRDALLGVSWDPNLAVDPRDALDWTLEAPSGLRFAVGPMGMLVFTQDGELKQEDHGAPIYFAASSMGRMVAEDLQTHAETEAYNRAQLSDVELVASRPFTEAVVEGWEVVTRAKDLETGVELMVHQIMLVTENGYVLMVGMVRASDGNAWQQRFRQAAISWKPRTSG